MLPKSKYMKLSPAAKSKLKKKLGMAGPRAVQSRLKGHGDYFRFDPSQVMGGKLPFRKVKGAGKGVGAQLGRYFGGKTGAIVGGAAHRLFKKITGFGDYKVASNTLVAGTDPPVFNNDGRGVRVTHREFLGDIVGTTAFTNTSFPINPGLILTFPWFAQLAGNFEQYRMNGLVFEFKTTSATSITSATNTSMGTVIMATEYNSLSANFTSKSAMENHEFCTSAVPSVSFMHPVECAKNETTISTQYIRAGAVPSGQDARFYDLGNFQIATVGMQASNTIGELWCTFDCTLYKPVLNASLNNSVLIDHYQLPAATLSNTDHFGTVFPAVKVPTSNLGTSITLTNVINLPPTTNGIPAAYFVHYSVVGAVNSALTNSMTWSGSTGVSIPALFLNDTSGRSLQQSAATSNVQFFTFFIDVAAGLATPTMSVTGGTLPGTIVGGDLFIQETSPFLLTQIGLAKSKITRSLTEGKEEKSEEKEDDEDDVDDLELLIALMKKKRRAAKKAESKVPIEDDEGFILESPASPSPPSMTLEQAKAMIASSSSSSTQLPPASEATKALIAAHAALIRKPSNK